MEKTTQKDSLLDCYFETLCEAYRTFYDDSNYRVLLRGVRQGYPCVSDVNRVPFEGSDSGRDVELRTNDGEKSIVFVHRSVRIEEEKEKEMELDSNSSAVAVLLLKESDSSGLYRLEMDENERAAFTRLDFFSDEDVVSSDDERTPGKERPQTIFPDLFKKDHTLRSVLQCMVRSGREERMVLSGQLFLDEWKERAGANFVLMYRFGNPEKSELDSFALKSSPAFVLNRWPSKADDWSTRRRNWPSQDVVRKAGRQPVYAVPFVCSFSGKSTTSRDADYAYAWQLDFFDTEEVLLENLDALQRRTFHVFRRRFWEENECRCHISFQNLLLRHAFLWTLETTSVGGTGTEKDGAATSLLADAIATMDSFVERNRFPHYFTPDVDLLHYVERIDVSCIRSCSDLRTILKDMTKTLREDDAESETEFERKFDVDEDDVRRERLCDAFEQSCSLLFLLLHQRLNSTKHVDEAIRRHLSVLSRLDRNRDDYACREFVDSIRAYVMSSLGMKFLLASSLGSKSDGEIDTLLSSAEEYLEKSVGLAPSSDLCAVSLALFLAATEKAATAAHDAGRKRSVTKVVDSFVNEVDGGLKIEIEKKSKNDTEEFSRRLLRRWTRSCDRLDFAFSELDRAILPDSIVTTFNFTRVQILGCPPVPVYALSSRFLVDVLAAESLLRAGREDEGLELLRDLERELLDESKKDLLNDKSLVACFFIVASVYLTIDRESDGRRLLASSSALFRNPRNPANWAFFAMRVSKMKAYLKWGLRAVVAGGAFVACVAVSIGHLRT